MQFIKGNNIPITLQLINSDTTYDKDATVTYDIYSSDLSSQPIAASSTTWNGTLNCYYDNLDVSVDWIGQSAGNYVIKWNISGTDTFATTLIEQVSILNDISDIAEGVWDELSEDNVKPKSFGYLVNTIQTDIKRTLGLMHENIHIDTPTYDSDNNLIGARVRIYSNPDRVGTDLDVIGTYDITSVADGAGKFTTWQQTQTYTDVDTFLLEDGYYLLLENGERLLLE